MLTLLSAAVLGVWADGISYGGAGSGESYTREFSSTWDNEW